ncbi:MAG: hypothetical protein QE265_01970 [Rhodoferax sp.]|nr:hypothetical protein [Rhodoferax sp.]
MNSVVPEITAAWAAIDWASALSDTALCDLAGAGVFQRGQTYAASGAVQEAALEPLQDGGVEFRACVMGTQPYTCEVQLTIAAEVQGECDCPHAQDGNFCKHQVALALLLRGLLGGAVIEQTPETQKKVAAAAKRAQTQAKNRDALHAFVRRQSAAVLAERLLQWAERDRNLLADLKAWAAQAQAADDPKALRTVLGELLKHSGFLDWHGSGVYARRAEKVLPLLEQALEKDPIQARSLCDYALRRLYKVGEQADDSNGEIGELMGGVMGLLLRSLQLAPPPAQWVDDWFALMEADPWGLWHEDAVLKVAGSAVQQRFSQRVQKDWLAWVGAHSQDATTRAGKKHVAVTMGGRWDYERSKLRKRYLEDLKRQGDVMAVIEAMRTSMHEAYEHGELVAYCELVGKMREALQYAQAAYKLFPNDWRSEADVLRCYERDGWDAEALFIRRKQLEKNPSSEHFHAVLKAAQAAGQDVHTYRNALFAWAAEQELHTEPRALVGYQRRIVAQAAGRNVSVRVAWLLSEKAWEQALQLVQPPHVCAPDLLQTLAKKLPKAQAPQAVALLQRVFAVAMPGASTPYTDVLALVADMAARMEREPRSHWLAWLRAEYKAKRNFIKGLDALRA